MKTLCFSTTIAVFLLICSNGIQAQTTQTKLDQLKLAQTFFIGTWQHVISKDTVEVSESSLYGKAIVSKTTLIIKGKESFKNSLNAGFSLKEGKFKGFILFSNGNYMTYLGSYITEKKFSADLVQNFDSAKILAKLEMVQETPTNITQTFFNIDGVKTGESKWTKIK